MDGLYALKPWYAGRLAGLRARLVAHHVCPNLISAAGVVAGAGAGLALATGAGFVVAPLVALRLGAANLDGAVARDTGRTSPWGSVVNEIGDRAAELAMFAGAAFVAPPTLVAAAALAATLPSWVSLAGAAAGAPRRNGGPVGKTERAALLALGAVVGHLSVVLAVIAVGSVVTAVVRAGWVRRTLVGVVA
jgi:CDP-diacylglycerol---glycerol-3-phosphate 3-phosphatidyltransferase